MRTPRLSTTVHACARALCATLALLACLLTCAARAEGDGMLRVKLARLGAPGEITLRADCDYRLRGDDAVVIPAGTELTAATEGGALILSWGGSALRLGGEAELIRLGDGFRGVTFLSPALSNRFCGDLCLSASQGTVSVVLRVYIEDYLYGVVGCEMPPSSGIEALKAQAVVARTCALAQKAARSGAAYDLLDAGDALSFRGYSAAGEYADAMRAVDATRGQALYYDGDLALCYFCDSNGGQTESSANALGAPLPYSDVRDDPYDLEGGGTRRTAALRADGSDLAPELQAALVEALSDELIAQGFDADLTGARVTAIEDIVPESPRYPEPSRLYRTLAFQVTVAGKSALGEAVTGRGTARVPTYGGVEDWYDLSINEADNETVAVERSDRAFEITFRREGSGLGMSQRGAQAMARKGLDCETILDYYYPGARLTQLSLSAERPQAEETRADIEPIATARLSQRSRLYPAADDAAAPLTTLPAGATVDVYAVQADWATVGSGDFRGFLHADALTSFSLVGVTAAQVDAETLARISGGGADLMQLPVDTARVLERLEEGAVVRLNAYTEKWALVTAESGSEGFIPRDAMTLHAEDGDGGDDIVTAQEDLMGILTADAGLYVNADDTVAPRRTLSAGDYVRILAYSSAWASVQTRDGEGGYVKLEHLSAVQQAQAQPDDVPEGGEIVRVQGKVFAYVAVDALSLFETWSTDADVLATLQKGEKVRLGAYNDKWACVRAGERTGFVLRSGLTEKAPDARAFGDAIEGGEIVRVKGERYAVVLTDDTPLYPSWSDSDSPLAVLSAGQRVRVGAYNRAWACVLADGVTGFVRIEALKAER